MLVDPLAEFGALTKEGVNVSGAFSDLIELKSFTLTDFGSNLLEALAAANPMKH